MGRRKRVTGEVKIELTTSPAVYGLLVEMVESGLYGTTIEQAAEELVRTGVRDYLRGAGHR